MKKLELLPHQVDGVERMLQILKQHKALLLADEQGLGKTVQCIVTLERLGIKKCLILCPPKLAISVWKSSIEKWTNKKCCLDEEEFEETDADILICPYSQIKKQLYTYDKKRNNFTLKVRIPRRFGLVIADESHTIKNRKAATTKFCVKATRDVHYKICVTGTPMPNRTEEIYAQLEFLDALDIAVEDERYRPYYWFTRRYCGGRRGHFGYTCDGSTNTKELQDGLSKVIVRREKGTAIEIPKKRYQIVDVNCDTETTAYQDFTKITEDHLIGEYYKRQKRVMIERPDDIDFVPVATIRKNFGISKSVSSIPFILRKIKAGEKVVVFIYHKECLAKIMEGLAEEGIQAVQIDGSTSPKKVSENVDKFQNDENVMAIVCQVISAGVGITLTASACVIFVEYSYSIGQLHQAVDRCHRYGQDKSVMVYMLVEPTTVDKRVLKILLNKDKNIKQHWIHHQEYLERNE